MLLGLANLLDAAEEIQDPFRLMSASYKNMYGWIPNRYKKHNFYQLVSRSLKTELIEKIEKNGEIYIRITTKGKKTIQRDFPMLQLQNRKWDRKWRIVMFDVEEINKKIREGLRRKLKELGFGMLQKSVFISPHDIIRDFSEFAQSAGIKDYLYLLETYRIIIGDEREFANKIWKLDDLNERYRDIVSSIHEIRSEMKNSHMVSIGDRMQISDSKREKGIGKEKGETDGKEEADKGEKTDKKEGARNIRNIKARWLKVIADDPFLPKAFLPKPWYGDKAKNLLKDLMGD